jgi:hypothetical protein
MMKSWADHCSSDEEDSVHDEEEAGAGLADDADSSAHLPATAEEEVGGGGGASDGSRGAHHHAEKVYDFPDRPPFTAFVGNLAFTIKEPTQLQQAVADAVRGRFGQNVDVIGGRIAFDRVDPNKHRGFGYVEVDTLEQVGRSELSLRDVSVCVSVCGAFSLFGAVMGGVVVLPVERVRHLLCQTN